METDNETIMPEKWRNRFFRYVAGGYDGCVWHVAFVLIDKKGTPRYIGNDGAGKIRDLENALESEFVRHEEQSWDHEFEEFDVSSREKVIELCKSMAKSYRDVCVQASVANMLTLAGYDGAGCVCSDCGEYFESSEYAYDGCDDGGGFHNCIDNESYCGCGGLAVDMTRILCDRCRCDTECPRCRSPNLPNPNDPSVEKGHEYDHYTFRERFIAEWIGVCDSCAYNFFTEDAHKCWDEAVDELEEKCDELDAELAEANRQLEKYLEVMKAQTTPEHLEELRQQNLADIATRIAPEIEAKRRELVNGLRDRMEKDVLDHYGDDVCNGRESERL